MADEETAGGKGPIDPKELDEMSGGSSDFLKLDAEPEHEGAVDSFLKLD